MKNLVWKNGWPVILYFIVINAIFIQMPLSGSLPGNLDTWANLSMFKDMGNVLASLFSNHHLASSNYPCQHIWPLYGLDFFSGIIFLFYRASGMSDLWAYHFYITTVFALNSFSIYKLCSLYSNSRLGCLLAGLFFSISNFFLANIDNPNIVLCFAGWLAIYFLIRTVRENSIKFLCLFILFICIQLLLAPVTCVMLFFAWGPFCLYHFRRLFSLFKQHWVQYIPIVISIGALVPYVYYYMILRIPTTEYNGTRMMHIASYLSMSFDDFFRTLPNNLLFHEKRTDWIFLIKSGYTGIALVSVSAVGAAQFRRARFPVFIALTGVLLSMGPYISYRSYPLFPSPLLLLYKFLPISDYLRIPARFFIVGVGGLVILFSIGWEKLSENRSVVVKIAMCLIPLVYIVENLPFPFRKYPSYQVFDNGVKAEDYIKQSNYQNVLNLPSKLFQGEDYREYVYMYYQAINGKNTINGSLAYFPTARLRNDTLCRNADQPIMLQELIKKNSVDLIVYHSDLADTSEFKILDALGSAPFLTPIDTTGVKKIFAVKE